MKKCLKGREKKDKKNGKDREELPKTPRKVKIEALHGTMEQENSSALIYNIDDDEGTY